MPEHAPQDEQAVAVAPVGIAALEFRGAKDAGDDLMAKARARAADPKVLDEHPPLFFTVRASDNTVDSYFTRMMPSTLRNYAEDARAGRGVPFLDSHRGETIDRILGRSVDGKFVNGEGEQGKRAELTFYTQPTLRAAMQAFVDMARGGYAADVSVGFTGGRMVCSICGGDMRWWRSGDREKRCYHIPGFAYKKTDESGTEVGESRVAIGLIEDARLGETSTVHKGSNANAGFIGFKARALALDDLLIPQDRSAFEDRYGLPLPGRARPHVVPTDLSRQEDPMPTKPEGQESANAGASDAITRAEHDAEVARAVAAERDSLTETVARALADAGHPVAEGASWADAIAGLGAEVRRLKPLADEGVKWRADLVERVIVEGTRAYGAGFGAEAERDELKQLPIEAVQRRLKLYAEAAGTVFAGGRQTKDGERGQDDDPQKITPITNRGDGRQYRA